MSFFAPFLDLISLANQIISIINNLNSEKEKAKEELKKKGIDIDLKLGIIITPKGTKGAIIFDLPGNIEESIASVLKYMGVDVEVYKAQVD